MRDSEFVPLFPVLFGTSWHPLRTIVIREPPSIFSNFHWYLSQLILSEHCEMIHRGNSSNEDAEPNGQENSEYLRLDDVSGETIR